MTDFSPAPGTLPTSSLTPARFAVVLAGIVLAAVVLRALPALDYGQDWYGRGTFTLVNFDEGGSCRAALGGFPYSPLAGVQTLALAALGGHEAPTEAYADPRIAKAFCHSEGHLIAARLYSAILGGLTVGVVALLSLQLFPRRRGLALGAAALLGLSGWHISESMVGTVDAPSTFFIYLFLLLAVLALRRGGVAWPGAAAALVFAVGTKYWVFALVALAALVPTPAYRRVLAGLGVRRGALLLGTYALLFGLVSNPAAGPLLRWLLPLGWLALVPWQRLSIAGRICLFAAPWLAPLAMYYEPFVAYASGYPEGRFGTDYGAIGWHRPLRNLLNLPAVLVVGLGLPAFGLLVRGVGVLALERNRDRAWLALLPLLAFALYMAFLAPVTYYRHYLPLLPAAALLAALGACSLGWRPALLWSLVLVWQALLAWDLVSDYRYDPRRSLASWYAQHQPQRVLNSYYVNPPPASAAVHRLFRVPYASDQRLAWADTVILSENWYDTAFANELNGPLVADTQHLIKTTPEAAAFYRAALAREHPRLEHLATLRAPTFMPELQAHHFFYGSFTQFVGDLQLFRVRP